MPRMSPHSPVCLSVCLSCQCIKLFISLITFPINFKEIVLCRNDV